MWTESEKCSIFMLLWLIAGSVVFPGVLWYGVFATLVGVIYAVLTIYHSIKGGRNEHKTD